MCGRAHGCESESGTQAWRIGSSWGRGLDNHGQSGGLEPEGGCGAGTETEDNPTTRDL